MKINDFLIVWPETEKRTNRASSPAVAITKYSRAWTLEGKIIYSQGAYIINHRLSNQDERFRRAGSVRTLLKRNFVMLS